MLPQVLINGLMLTVTFAILAVGLSVTFSVMGVLNFALGAISMIGSYTVYLLTVRWNVNYMAALGIAFLIAGLIGLAMQKGFIQRVRYQVLICMVITLALSNMIQGSVSLVTPGEFLTLGPFIGGVMTAGDISVATDRVAIVILGGLFILATWLIIERSKMGKAMRATSMDEEVASLQGVKTSHVFLFSMFLSSGLAGLAGGLAALVSPLTAYMADAPLMNAFIIVVLGGLGSLGGALMASAVMGFMNSFATTYFGAIAANAASFAILVLILMVRPRGLLGKPSAGHKALT